MGHAYVCACVCVCPCLHVQNDREHVTLNNLIQQDITIVPAQAKPDVTEPFYLCAWDLTPRAPSVIVC